jgi:uncharacterized protein YyaL (SSP411 family)
MRTSWLFLSALAVGAAACRPAATPRALGTAPGVLATAGLSATAGAGGDESPSGAPRKPLAWASLEPATFARARAERRFVLLDGAAEWCHWCHVMEATTYHDPAVRKILDAHFLAVKVDVDARPDVEERYGAWGWPATVLMTADGQEIGKYRGYLPPERLLEILQAVVDSSGGASNPDEGDAVASAEGRALSEEEIAAVVASTEKQLDDWWDPREGGWGHRQKLPLAWDNAWELVRARAGDGTARQRVLFALDRQRAILDPVWGGLCQYSTDGDWQHPHYEKLMTYQAGAIDNYAAAYALTHQSPWLATAQSVRGFVDRFMTGPDGGFYTTMDADLNAHDPARPYVLGKDYYAGSDAERRALGIPRIDTHEYTRENGLVIAAYVTLFEASADASALAAAERAAQHILATHATDQGELLHGPYGQGESGKVLYLADNAAFGFALTRLAEVTRKPEYLEAARRIGTLLTGALLDATGGGFYASTPDPDAIGVFVTRRKPFEDDVMAIRFLARLDRLAPSDAYRGPIARAIAVVGKRQTVEERGRMVGDLLLALEETKGVR